MKMRLIARGAEAELYSDKSVIVKKRVKKDYRISEIDTSLRRFRTKREAKVLNKAKEAGINVPLVKKMDVDDGILEMEEIIGMKVRDKLNSKNYLVLCKNIGGIIANLHNNDMIHGDLTTSNMIYENKSKKIFLIDFGLSFFSLKVEDKAVDIHLFRQALESKHNKIWESAFKAFISGYKSKSKDYDEVLNRFEKVESRGRNKTKS